MPIDGRILYIQPVYVTLPEQGTRLWQVIVSQGESAAICRTAEEALKKLGIGKKQ